MLAQNWQSDPAFAACIGTIRTLQPGSAPHESEGLLSVLGNFLWESRAIIVGYTDWHMRRLQSPQRQPRWAAPPCARVTTTRG